MIAIVQARMGSQRLPGKILTEVASRPLLTYLLDRLRLCSALSEVVVATSDESGDDPVAELCLSLGVRCVRGSQHDVAGRYTKALEAVPCEAFVRLSGDSPLLDPEMVSQAAALFHSGDWDLVTNVMPRSFPPGQSVEALSAEAFLQAYPQMTEPHELEHVTPFFYQRADRYRICNFAAPADYAGVNMAIDTPEHLETFRKVTALMDRPPEQYGLDAAVELYRLVARRRE